MLEQWDIYVTKWVRTAVLSVELLHMSSHSSALLCYQILTFWLTPSWCQYWIPAFNGCRSKLYTIYLYPGLNNLRDKIKYILKARPVQGQLMPQLLYSKQYPFFFFPYPIRGLCTYLECFWINYFKQFGGMGRSGTWSTYFIRVGLYYQHSK